MSASPSFALRRVIDSELVMNENLPAFMEICIILCSNIGRDRTVVLLTVSTFGITYANWKI